MTPISRRLFLAITSALVFTEFRLLRRRDLEGMGGPGGHRAESHAEDGAGDEGADTDEDRGGHGSSGERHTGWRT